MNDWLGALAETRRNAESGVLITVAQAKGSTPREPGTKMLITRNAIHGTIGGGNLEYKAIEIARAALAEGLTLESPATLRRFPLGPSLGQCCGGVAVLLFEPIPATRVTWMDALRELSNAHESAVMVSCTDTPCGSNKLVVTATDCHGSLVDDELTLQALSIAREKLVHEHGIEVCKIERPAREAATLVFEPVRRGDFQVVLFGAGHVGAALVRVLAPLPCAITWIDSRGDQFPRDVPANVTAVVAHEPELEVDGAPSGSYLLIMTHSHPLDQAICERALQRDDLRYCGLIGSAAKLHRFRKRLAAGGLSPDALAGLTCPIGIDGIAAKHPAAIAIAVAAELLQVRERTAHERGQVRRTRQTVTHR
ncbi:MAG: xanthine dehydrogenase accessory protein XdhC [Gammaproteobacteria bacterium]